MATSSYSEVTEFGMPDFKDYWFRGMRRSFDSTLKANMKKSVLSFIYDQWSGAPLVEKVDLAGKTVVVVGGNNDIGLEAAKHFATMNPQKLVLTCPSDEKGQATVNEIERSTGFKGCTCFVLDLSSFASVTDFVAKVENECKDLNILVMDDAIFTRKYEPTVDGWESIIQVNHLSPSLISLLLLPRLLETGHKAGTPSRLVVVSSDVHYWVTFEEEVLTSERPLETLSSQEHCTPARMAQRYFDSRLLSVLFVRALNERLQDVAPLIVDAVNPGFSSSCAKDYSSASVLEAIIMFVMETFLAWAPEEASHQVVWAAVGGKEDEEKLRGAYISKGQITEPSDFVLSELGKQFQDKIWSETIDNLSKASPNVQAVCKQYFAK